MEPLLLALTLNVGFFLVLLLAQKARLRIAQFCALCAATVGTWLTLLALRLFGLFDDALIIAVFMGGSSVGLVYLFEKHSSQHGQIFKFPLYLSLIVLVYSVLNQSFILYSLVLLSVLWFLSGIIYLGRRNTVLKNFAEQLIACCKNW